MFAYYIVSIFSILLAFTGRKESNRYALPLAFVIITAFLSLGYMWGNDVPTYEAWFNQYKDSGTGLFEFSNYIFLNLKLEFGWVFINLLCKKLGFWGMRAILFAVENYIIYQLISKHVPRNMWWFSVFVYTVNPFFMILSSSMMRQWLAMCIIIYAVEFLLKGKRLRYVIFVIIAATIHKSSIICLPIAALPHIVDKFSSKLVLTSLLVYAIYFIASNYFVENITAFLNTEEMYNNYTDSMYSSGIGILNIIIVAIYILMCSSLSDIEHNQKLYLAILLCFAFVLPLYFYSGLAARLSFYFTIFTIAAYPIYYSQSKQPKIIRFAILGLAAAILIYKNIIFWNDPSWLSSFGNYTTLFEAKIL